MVTNANKLTGSDKTSALEVANSKLVFPSDDIYTKLHYYVSFDNVADQQTFQKTFEPITLG